MSLRELLYKTLTDLAHPIKSSQEIIKITIVLLKAQALKETLPFDHDPLIACILKRKIEVCGAANILVRIKAVIPICLVQCRGTLFIFRADIAFIFNEVSEPVVLGAVFIYGFLHTRGDRNSVIQIYDLLRAFDYPRQDAFTCIGIEVFRIVLFVIRAFDLSVKRDYDKPAPDTVIGGADTRQMVCVEYQRMARRE